jgi:hypothetical protein
MFYYFKKNHKLLEGKLEFKKHDYMFNSYEILLYSVPAKVEAACWRDCSIPLVAPYLAATALSGISCARSCRASAV